MDAVRANQLRATIQTLTAEGLSPTAVARRLGCARGTVYNALARPGLDRRTRAAHPEALALDACSGSGTFRATRVSARN